MSVAGAPIDILWGWDAIAAALGVDIKTARALAGQKERPLPVWTGTGKTVQSTRTVLQDWANKRAWALAAETQKEGKKSQ